MTVDLAGDRPVRIGRVQVSAMLRPSAAGDPEGPNPAQNRFTALRAFRLLACDATRADCSRDAGYRTVYSSPDDAFPADRPRPTAPDIALRSFDVRHMTATHLRLQAVGGPARISVQASRCCHRVTPWVACSP